MTLAHLHTQSLEPPRETKPSLHEVILSVEHEAITALGVNSNLEPNDEAAHAIAIALSSGRLALEDVQLERGIIELSRQIGRTIAQVTDEQHNTLQYA